jgi:hydrogenase-4 component H
VCPEKAITMSQEFETATNAIRDISQQIELFMSTCQRCGRCFPKPSPLEALKLTGYRFDDPANERWVFRSAAYLGPGPADDLTIDLDESSTKP